MHNKNKGNLFIHLADGATQNILIEDSYTLLDA